MVRVVSGEGVGAYGGVLVSKAWTVWWKFEEALGNAVGVFMGVSVSHECPGDGIAVVVHAKTHVGAVEEPLSYFAVLRECCIEVLSESDL